MNMFIDQNSIRKNLMPLDMKIDFQGLRHSALAEFVRSTIYRMIVGKEDWPIVFTRPDVSIDFPYGTSSNLYIHLPFCRQICPHCPYNKTLYKSEAHYAYGKALQKEIESYLRKPNILQIESLYFGGGTPTATLDLIEMSIDLVRPFLAPGAEIGVEVYPSDANVLLLKRIKQMGVNRISLGVETFRADLLKMLGRTYTPEQAENAIRMACTVGFDCVDTNLIYGIPGQDMAEPTADALRCISAGADQISAYPLFTFIHTPLGSKVKNKRFPIYGDRSRMNAQKALSKICRNAGLIRTSVWSFTRPNISPYSTVTHEDYIGFGAGAGSKVDGIFWFNTFSVDAYSECLNHRPAIMMRAGNRFRRAHWLYWQFYRTAIDPYRYQQLFDRNLEREYGWLFSLLAIAKLAYRDEQIWRLTETGAVWIHRLQCLFSLTYIDKLWKRCQSEPWPEEIILA